MKIEDILNQIDNGSYALPEFQRGYVWNRDQVKKLMYSLYRGYPIGGLLIWVTESNSSITRCDGLLAPGTVNLILDGQQRMTSLYGIIRGHAPKFFDGNAASFTGLYFNLQTEEFEFYLATKMKDHPEWISVTELLKNGAMSYISHVPTEQKTFLIEHLETLNRLDSIRQTDLHTQLVTGSDKTIDVVVEIFNNVNSGGTKLSKGDLALARICGQWIEARDEMKSILAKLQKAGYSFTLEWLLRCITVHLTGRPYFSELGKVTMPDFQKALYDTDKEIGICLDHIGSRLGLDHDRVLGSRFAIVTMIGYFRQRGTCKLAPKEWDQLLYWYIHTMLWGRYAGSTESIIAQDLNIINGDEGVEGLIKSLRQSRGDLTLHAQDFWGWSTGARFYPLLYMLTRVNHALDFSTGIELSHNLLGKNSSLEVHHIFPKDKLYREAKKSKSLVNSLANYAFITKDTNLEISNSYPEVYMPIYMQKHPGALESHCIPTHDPSLFKLDNYEDFLAERRRLLAEKANDFLNSLYDGTLSAVTIENYSSRVMEEGTNPVESEDIILAEVANWMEQHGLNSGNMNYPLISDAGEELTIIDLAWPEGIQTGLSKPVALLLNETAETQRIVADAGYYYFTEVEAFKQYVTSNYLL